MPEITSRSQSRLDPAPAWTVLTDAPLKGMAFAREAGSVLAWDEGDQLYILDLKGQHRSVSRAPSTVLFGAISDDGSLIVLVGEGARLWFLGADLDLIAERQGPAEILGVAIDPHGRYAALTARTPVVQFYSRHGRPAGKFEPRQALSFLAFVPDRAILLGAATQGLLAAYELRGQASSGRLAADEMWEERLLSNVGRLATTGDGGMILASCFSHGIQRFDLRGHNEGAYHLGGTAEHAVPDYGGRVIAVATLEGELIVLGAGGHVRWRGGLPRPVIALETDPLGRYVLYGHSTGEIVRLDLYSEGRASGQPAAPVVAAARPGGGSVRTPDWIVPLAQTDDQAETAVLAVLDDPPRVAAFISPARLQLFNTQGKNLGTAPEIMGVGRIIRTAPGWIAGATDRQIVVCDATKNTGQRVDLSLVEVTHLAIRPGSFGLAIVQERDRLARGSLSGRWVWKHELKSPVEDLAIGLEAHAAISSEDGTLKVFNPAGEAVGFYQVDPVEPIPMIEAPEGSPPGVAWLTLARRAQVLRGHDLRGRVLWQTPVAYEGWQFLRLGPFAVVVAADGRAQAFDGAGHLRGQSRASAGGRDEFAINARGEIRRISRQGLHVISSDLDGRVRWRAVAEQPLGPLAAGRPGVAVLIGRSLAWFSATK
jgi:hypothetical protein